MTKQFITLGDMPNTRPEIVELARRFLKATNTNLEFTADSERNPLEVIAVVTDRLADIQRQHDSVVSWLEILGGSTEDKFHPIQHLAGILCAINVQFTGVMANMGLGVNDFVINKADEMQAVVSQTFTSIVSQYNQRVGYTVVQGLTGLFGEAPAPEAGETD